MEAVTGTSESQGVGRASKGRRGGRDPGRGGEGRELLGWRCQWGARRSEV